MCAAALTEDQSDSAGLVVQAARGILPGWAEVSDERREHIARVAALMQKWADRLGLDPLEKERWVAAAWLHDALRDADPAQLRSQVPAALRTLPDLLLHGPAAAERLGSAVDEEVRTAVRYHTLGHPEFRQLGKALYLADFLEPGRDFEIGWRDSLRDRMPHQLDAVLIEVVAARLCYLARRQKPIRQETNAFWNTLVEEGDS